MVQRYFLVSVSLRCVDYLNTLNHYKKLAYHFIENKSIYYHPI